MYFFSSSSFIICHSHIKVRFHMLLSHSFFSFIFTRIRIESATVSMNIYFFSLYVLLFSHYIYILYTYTHSSLLHFNSSSQPHSRSMLHTTVVVVVVVAAVAGYCYTDWLSLFFKQVIEWTSTHTIWTTDVRLSTFVSHFSTEIHTNKVRFIERIEKKCPNKKCHKLKMM